MRARLAVSRLAIATALLARAGLAHAQVEEDTLKAAFVYNFALYTTWPTPLRAADALTICVQRKTPLASALHALVGKPVQQRTIIVKEIDRAPHSGCDVEVAASSKSLGARALGVLTVCDCGDDPAATGAAVSLVREGARLRFDVDLGAANASGLSLSSKLLHLARTTR
ncbi:MAG: YfiR family protein [Rhodanobacteraceae bacterium]